MNHFYALPQREAVVNFSLPQRRNYIRLLVDLLLISVSYSLIAFTTHRTVQQLDFLIVSGLAVGWYFSTKLTRLYDPYRATNYIGDLLVLIPNIVVQLVILVLTLFFIKDSSRIFASSYVLTLGTLVAIKLFVTRKILQYFQRKGLFQKHVVIVGEASYVVGISEFVRTHEHFGYNLIDTFLYTQKNHPEPPLKSTIEFLNHLVYQHEINELVVATSQFDENYIKALITWTDKHGILLRFTPNFVQISTARYSLELFGNYPLITVRSTPLEENYLWLVKRAFDIVFSLTFLVLVGSWLFPIIALLIKLDSRGPILFVQKRWGLKGRTFRVFKFRTMTHQLHPSVEFRQATQNDQRITRIGRFLRKTNLDELPQFINVLWGEMSVVGPRPHAVEHNLQTLPHIQNYMVRHRIKPGITGWAQINGFRGEAREIDLMRKRVDYDIWYIENWSFWLDIKVILITAYAMLRGDPKAY
ncbi:MAG: undecaprenyl-phosphate glucose phosphotransferase [Spirosomataceae bacterium]